MDDRLSRLQETLNRIWNSSSAYREKMVDADIKPGDIRSLDDLRRLPFTTKKDLRDNYPLGLLACDKSELVRIHASSGTTGKATVVAYTANDVKTWSDMVAHSLSTAGVQQGDVIQIAYGYGLFTGGIGIHYGAERLGATVIPASGGFSDRQLALMQDLGTTVLACTPSYALKLADLIEKRKIKTSLRLGIFGAEPWSEGLRSELEERLGIRAVDIYGLSEIMGPGVAIECPEQDGLHFDDRSFLVEIIDPETEEVLPAGSEGELVVTTLCKEALPMIRYRTRDITRILPGSCACGRDSLRIKRIEGRSDDMLIIRGVNVFPSQVEAALSGVQGLSLHYVLEVSEHRELKELTICCEAADALSEGATKELSRRTSAALAALLGIRTGVKILAPGTLERSDGKATRIRRVA